MLNNTILRGTLYKYIIPKNYGFIEAEDNNTYFFFNEKSKLSYKEQKSAHIFRDGDEVEFKIVSDDKNRQLAVDLTFIQNTKRDLLINEAKEQNILKGYLKKIDDDYFVKHITTYIFIPVYISDWEKDLNLVYEARNNSLVEFELQNLNKPHKIEALLLDRVFSPEFVLLKEMQETEETTFAKITGSNGEGYFSTILNGTIHAFISSKIDNKILLDMNLRKGDIVEVKIKTIVPKMKKVRLVVVGLKN